VTNDDANLGERLPAVQELFRQLGDLLFLCSHELARTGGANWDRAEALFQLAKGADLLRDNVVSLLSNEDAPQPERQIPPSNGRATLKTSARRKTTIETGKPARKKKGEYPKYSVRGDLLVKTGLSRDARNEYDHFVPKKEFDAITSILAEFSTSKKHFAVEEVQARLHCPGYQIYTVLSLLKARKIVLVPRRGLYSFRAAKAFRAEAANLWKALRRS
jgi:hypothetical protein